MDLNKKLVFTKDYVFYTVQGEGRFVGTPSVFVRLSGCNLRCVWRNADSSKSLCDTAYSSHFPEKFEYSIAECVQEILKHPAQHCVITGGEPFMQKDLLVLISELKKYNKLVTVETNASLYFKTEADFISMSPKLSSSSVEEHEFYSDHQNNRLNWQAITDFMLNHDFQFKYVVNDVKDLHEVDSYYQECIRLLQHNFSELKKQFSDLDKEDLKIFLDSRMYLMPQALNKNQLDEKSIWIIEECKKRNWNFADRMHIRIWGPKRGV